MNYKLGRAARASAAKSTLGLALIALWSGGALAGDAMTYTYDALGRLVTVVTDRGAGNTPTSNASYDAAGNRTNYSVSAASSGGPPPNSPPVANSDNAGTMQKCSSRTVNVTANDTDPEGDYPLVVTAATSATISVTVANSTSLSILSSGATGVKTIRYTVRDARNATAMGTVTVNVSGGVCQ